MILCANEIAYLAVQGWGETTQPDGTPNALIAVAVCYGESRGDFSAIYQNKDSAKPSSGSQDLGGWMINNYWHRDKLLRTPAWRDPWVALSLAVQVFREWERRPEKPSGWEAWKAYKPDALPDGTVPKPSYLGHLAKAKVGLLAPMAPPGGMPSATTRTALGLSPAAPPAAHPDDPV
jgi:hypothetical protein